MSGSGRSVLLACGKTKQSIVFKLNLFGSSRFIQNPLIATQKKFNKYSVCMKLGIHITLLSHSSYIRDVLAIPPCYPCNEAITLSKALHALAHCICQNRRARPLAARKESALPRALQHTQDPILQTPSRQARPQEFEPIAE